MVFTVYCQIILRFLLQLISRCFQTLRPRRTRRNFSGLLCAFPLGETRNRPLQAGWAPAALLTRVAFAVSHPGCFLSSDKSNLLVCRSSQGAELPPAPSLHTHNISQMVFHKIRREDLVLVGERLLSM